MKKLSIFLLLVLLIGVGTSFAQNKTDLTGTWVFDVDYMGVLPPFFLNQDSEGNITGTYEGQLDGKGLQGPLIENDFHLEFLVEGNLVYFDGKIENDILGGKMKIGKVSVGTFTGKRKEL